MFSEKLDIDVDPFLGVRVSLIFPEEGYCVIEDGSPREARGRGRPNCELPYKHRESDPESLVLGVIELSDRAVDKEGMDKCGGVRKMLAVVVGCIEDGSGLSRCWVEEP